jgi:deoxyribodipyrimidine photo-lyase
VVSKKRQMSRIATILSFENSNSVCIYFMTKSYRIKNNYSLFEAHKFTSDNNLILKILIVEPYEENIRNLDFFKENTKNLIERLKNFSIHIEYLKRDFDVREYIKNTNTVFIDKAYLKFDIDMHEKIRIEAYKEKINMFSVEANVFVPVRITSDKEEYSARTIRSKINSKLDDYRQEVFSDSPIILGEEKALKLLDDFIDNKLEKYHLHNDPSLGYTSLLSSYLKYGFISPVTIYNKIAKTKGSNKDDFLEELIVRRELAYNFVYYNPTYYEFKYMTYDWAYNSMQYHLKDQREYIYSKDDYINFNTHDLYFNASMKEMIYLGRMHSYMRMYWCKKIIEWSNNYEEAYRTAIELNNYYFVDGLTPNGYCGIAWCFGKHDRAWPERKIFGKLRYMNANGLERKFDIQSYVKQMNDIEKRENK